MSLAEWTGGRWFNLVHRNNLVYNTCWEDPRLDRQALKLRPDDTLAVITSAGCNVLDYLLDGPRQIHSVDLNPRQNALLELKLAGVRQLDFETFFALFGQGRLHNCREVYEQRLRPVVSRPAQQFWDRHIHFFSGAGWRRSFYFHGTSGTFARWINLYIDRIAKVREAVLECLNAGTLDAQRKVYEWHLREAFWTRFMRWTMRRDTTLSFLGVPRAQRQQVEQSYPGGVVRFIQDAIDAVFGRLPLTDNYFWRVYLTGEYSPQCCPEYLKPENFERLKASLGGPCCTRERSDIAGRGALLANGRVSIHTCSLLEFLQRHPGRISRFVLLDHMDWLSARSSALLSAEWQAIVDSAAPGARVLWRSGGLRTAFVDRAKVMVEGRQREVGELLSYHRELAALLHEQDRVHTYGSFYIADLAA